MKKPTTSFVCQECGYDSPAYLGKCPECGSWNSMKEFRTQSGKKTVASGLTGAPVSLTPRPLSKISYEKTTRFTTSYDELDTVLGGGIVPGAVMLLAGDPGVGKSTLLLQVGLEIAKGGQKTPVLYISGEESEQQIKLRAERIAKDKLTDNFLLLSVSNTDAIVDVIQQTNPSLVIIDSIQTMESENVGGLSGSVGQVRYAAASFIKLAKQNQIPILIVGHVTKEGMVAGPMVLTHMVDTVLFLEGEKHTAIRILRSFKNRFGPVDEVGIFTMVGEGMAEIKNPEQIFLTKTQDNTPGTILTVTQEGSRAFLVEIQALAVYSKLPMPRRVASGVDAKRLELLLAVLQKHCRLPVETADVFVNVAGGLKLSDPAVDLSICLAVFSSLKNIPLPKTVAIAEIGLLGELRQVPALEKRVKEAQKLGFKKIITAQSQKSLMHVIQSVGK